MNHSFIIRDSIHGDISLTPSQLAALDTADVQRLRGVMQLGAAYLVYPGCTHTRFEHSLGTSATAQRILASLKRNGTRVSADDEELVGLGALLHDIAHMPFGHTLEDERKVLPRHDKAERLLPILREGELGATLRSLGVLTAIEQLLLGEDGWRSQVIASSLDADLLDYLRRDSVYAGIAQNYDDRVYQYFFVADGQLAVNLAKNGMDRSAARSEIIHLLRMRGFLMERVYMHHAKVAAGAMVSKAVEIALANGASVPFLTRRTDASLLSWLAGEFTAPLHTAAAELAQGVLKRRLYKRAYGISGASLLDEDRAAITNRYHLKPDERDRCELRIAAQAGVAAHHVLVCCTGEPPLREVTMPAYTRHGLHPLNAPPGSYVTPQDIRSIEDQHKSMWRLWVFAEARAVEAVAKAAATEFGYSSELQR